LTRRSALFACVAPGPRFSGGQARSHRTITHLAGNGDTIASDFASGAERQRICDDSQQELWSSAHETIEAGSGYRPKL
jgi:hypothetical protein